MIESTELKKLKEDYPDFFRKTSAEIIDFIFSEKTSERIANICKKNGVTEEGQVEGIAQRVTWVMLDKLPSGNLAITLELWVNIASETAKKVADEANQFISSAMAQLRSGANTLPEKKPAEKPVIEEKSKRPLSKDTYREQIE